MNKNIFVALLLASSVSLPMLAHKYEDLRHFRKTGYTECDGCDLSGLSFAYWHFKDGLSLNGADLRGTDFTGAIAEKADFSNADCTTLHGWVSDTQTCFDRARLNESAMNGVDAQDASFRYAKMKLVEANNKANFRDADFTGADCEGIEANDADFRGSKLKRAMFVAAELCRSHFEGACKCGTDFTDADTYGATGLHR